MRLFNFKKGFTLIELLVVVSIVGLLSTVVVSSMSTTRAKARDAKRIATLKEIEKALELYAADHNGQYSGYLTGESSYVRSVSQASEAGSPPSGCGYGAPGTAGEGSPSYAPGIWCRFKTSLSSYLNSIPDTDLIGSNYLYFIYKVPSNSVTYNPLGVNEYGLAVKLEVPNDVSRNDGGWYDDFFELGGLPKYCKAKNSSWNSWSGVPCSCIVYFSSGCVY